jgi:hypothetical protein
MSIYDDGGDDDRDDGGAVVPSDLGGADGGERDEEDGRSEGERAEPEAERGTMSPSDVADSLEDDDGSEGEQAEPEAERSPSPSPSDEESTWVEVLVIGLVALLLGWAGLKDDESKRGRGGGL